MKCRMWGEGWVKREEKETKICNNNKKKNKEKKKNVKYSRKGKCINLDNRQKVP